MEKKNKINKIAIIIIQNIFDNYFSQGTFSILAATKMYFVFLYIHLDLNYHKCQECNRAF